MNILHLLRDMLRSPLDFCIFVVDTEILHMHQHSSILTRLGLCGRFMAHKHFECSANVRKLEGPFDLRWLQDINF